MVSALVVVGSLFGERVTGLPARMTPTDPCRPTVHLDLEAAAVLQAAAGAAVDAWGGPSPAPEPPPLNIRAR